MKNKCITALAFNISLVGVISCWTHFGYFLFISQEFNTFWSASQCLCVSTKDISQVILGTTILPKCSDGVNAVQWDHEISVVVSHVLPTFSRQLSSFPCCFTVRVEALFVKVAKQISIFANNFF